MGSSYYVTLTGSYISSTDSVGASEINIAEALMSELHCEQPIHARGETRPSYESRARTGGQARGFVVSFVDICIAMPITVFLTAFVKSFGSKLGEQSGEAVGKAFSAWINRVHHFDDRAVRHRVRIMDKQKKLIAHLPENLPPEAYDELVKFVNELPNRRFRRKYIILVYDSKDNWRASYTKLKWLR
jgi:hypothetical protein